MTEIPKKTKVLFVITKSNFGGAQKYVYDLAVGLPKDKFDVVVALGGIGTLSYKLQGQNIRTIQIFSLKRDVNVVKDVFSFFEMWATFISEKPDVVHLNSAKAGGIGALAARLSGVPKIIFTAHGWAFNEERPELQRSIITFFSCITVLLSHKTIAVSEAIKNDTKKWPAVSKKILVIKNGVKAPIFYSREEARIHLFALANVHVPEKAFVVGSITELHRNKGLQYSIEAFSKLTSKNPSFYYLILGGGEEEEALSAFILRLGLQKHVFLLGYVEEAVRFLPAFDIFVLPSIKEGLPYVILEAGLASLPTIATNIAGIPEIIEDKKTGILIAPQDTEAISVAVESLCNSPEIRIKLGNALNEKVLKDFSFERVLSDTSEIYLNP